MVIALVVVYVLTVLVSLVKPRRSTVSEFELRRRAQRGDKTAATVLGRDRLVPDVMVLRNFVLLLLIAGFMWIAAGRGFLFALGMTVLVVASIGPIGKLKFLGKLVGGAFAKVDKPVFGFAAKIKVVTGLFRDTSEDAGTSKVSSKEELKYIVKRADGAISDSERATILSALEFNRKIVKDIMVGRNKVETVGRGELLGPLELDRLHKTGHGHFPVVAGGLENVVGVLRLEDVLTVKGQESRTADAVMLRRVYYVREDYSLGQTLDAFIRTNFHFLMVVNEQRETVGIVTLGDLMRALLGGGIGGEFLDDDDKKAVAKRKPS